MVGAADLTSRLSALRVPMTWLDGADDRSVPAEARVGRPGQTVLLPDAGHLLPIEAPAAIADAILTAV